jgi:lipopolysaccharide export system permease protein
MVILGRHILRTHVAPFVFSVVLLMFIFLLQFLMKYLDQLAGKGLSAAVIAELITLNLAWMLVLAVPMGVLVATLMAFGGLASTNQITAMRASGVSLYRMIAPVLLAAIGICFLLIRFNNDVLPDANHRVRALTSDISRKKPTLSLVPGLFTQLLQGHSILVKKTFEASNDLEGVTILDHSNPSVTSTITATRGTISFSPDYRKLIMDLQDGEIHQTNAVQKNQYRIIKFVTHRIVMDAEGFNFQRTQESLTPRGDREMSAGAMQAVVDSIRRDETKTFERMRATLTNYVAELFSAHPSKLPPLSDTRISTAVSMQAGILRQSMDGDLMQRDWLATDARKFLVEIHKKYAIPVACIVFVFVGAPLGIMSRRGTFGVGASLSLGFFLLYWACLIGGEKLADRGALEPWIGMWMANIFIGSLGIYLTIRTARESLTIDWSALARFIPASWRAPQHPSEDA